MIQIIITRKCNFRCSHCMWACDSSGLHMPWEVFCRALEYAKKARAADLIGGEPTLQPHFAEMVSECSQAVSTMRIATNGSWVTNRRLNKTVSVAIREASAKLGKDNLYVRLSEDKWHRRFQRDVTADGVYCALWDWCTLYSDHGEGVVYPIGRAAEGEAYEHAMRHGYHTAPAECTKGEYSFWCNASIDVDGSVSPCPHHQAVCGNIMTDSMITLRRRAERFIARRRILAPTNSDCARCAQLV